MRSETCVSVLQCRILKVVRSGELSNDDDTAVHYCVISG